MSDQVAAGWVIRDIADGLPPLGERHRQLVAGSRADLHTLTTHSTLQLAAADSLQTDSLDAELVDASRPPVDALRDLSLLDARFGEDVLDRVLHRLLEAWPAAAHGLDAQLRTIALPAAIDQLLHPAGAPTATTVVHDVELLDWAPRLLDAGTPARLDVDVQVEAIRYATAVGEAVPSAAPSTCDTPSP